MTNPMMHRAQFKLIAEVLGKAMVEAELDPSQRLHITRAFGKALAKTNDAFDFNRFELAVLEAEAIAGGSPPV